MRAVRTLAVTATAIAAVGLAAPLAAATNNGGNGGTGGNGGPREVTISPAAVHQGSTLTITVRGCTRGGTVTSNAFPQTNLSVNSNAISTAIARVFNHATPGNYNLAVRCNDNPNDVATRQFTVLEARGALGGIGGSLAPSSTETAVGGSLVAAAALGGGLFIIRRRRLSSGKV